MKQIHDFFVSETVNAGPFANNIIREKEEMFPGFMKAVLDGIAFFYVKSFSGKPIAFFLDYNYY
jgi:hypothetical protein